MLFVFCKAFEYNICAVWKQGKFSRIFEGGVSITVIATGFETKKVNEPVTIKLEDTDDIGSSDSNDLEIINDNVQQTLSLEDDESFDFEHLKSDEVNLRIGSSTNYPIILKYFDLQVSLTFLELIPCDL